MELSNERCLGMRKEGRDETEHREKGKRGSEKIRKENAREYLKR